MKPHAILHARPTLLGRFGLVTTLLALFGGPSLLEAAAPVGQWWNASYRYRQKLSLTAGATLIPAQYSVRPQFDHAAMVAVSQSLASGNDVRVAYWNGSGWIELDRRLDDQSAWNTATTQIWFRTQAAIGVAATDDNYYLYYGNSGAGTPPTNWANVFLFYDDFNDGIFDAARWICVDPFSESLPTSCAEGAGTMTLGTNDALNATPGFAFGINTRWESRLQLASNLPLAGAFYNYFGASDSSSPNFYSVDWITFWASQFQHETETSNDGLNNTVATVIPSPTSFHVYTFDREGGTAVRFHQDGAQVRLANVPGTVANANLRPLSWNDGTTAGGIVLDWVRVRRYVTPEPTFATATAENGPGQMRVLSGSYTGNGVDDRPVFVGFQPDLVIIDNAGGGFRAVARSSPMAGDNAKDLDSANPLTANKIQSLTATGFTIGSDVDVNQNGIPYEWIAFRAAPGQLVVGSYGGTGSTQDITGLGLSPAYVLVMSAGGHDAVQKSSPMPANFSEDFGANGFTTAILNMLPDGFRVGTDVSANNAGTTYYFAAWAAVPGRVAVGTYGGAAVPQTFLGLGFFPEWVVVSRSSNGAGSQGNPPAHKPASTGVTTDWSLLFDGPVGETNNITALFATGFTVGTHCRVNCTTAPSTYYWVAFGPHTPSTYYRSIGDTTVTYGTAGTTGVGTRVNVTNGSATVGGLLGTTWRTSNRGRGDVITIPCDDPPACLNGASPDGVHYMILGVSADNSLQLSRGYLGATNPSATYVIRRQFSTLPAWEDCISGAAPTCNNYFPVTGGNLVTEDRSEVGIAYKDVVYNAGANVNVLIDGSTTDATHTITLTADPGNRHNGIAGNGRDPGRRQRHRHRGPHLRRLRDRGMARDQERRRRLRRGRVAEHRRIQQGRGAKHAHPRPARHGDPGSGCPGHRRHLQQHRLPEWPRHPQRQRPHHGRPAHLQQHHLQQRGKRRDHRLRGRECQPDHAPEQHRSQQHRGRRRLCRPGPERGEQPQPGRRLDGHHSQLPPATGGDLVALSGARESASTSSPRSSAPRTCTSRPRAGP